MPAWNLGTLYDKGHPIPVPSDTTSVILKMIASKPQTMDSEVTVRVFNIDNTVQVVEDQVQGAAIRPTAMEEAPNSSL